MIVDTHRSDICVVKPLSASPIRHRQQMMPTAFCRNATTALTAHHHRRRFARFKRHLARMPKYTHYTGDNLRLRHLISCRRRNSERVHGPQRNALTFNQTPIYTNITEHRNITHIKL